MPNQNNTLIIVAVLVGIGAGVIFLTMNQNNSRPANKVVMQDVFSAKPQTSSPQTPNDPVPSPAIVTSPEHGKEAGFAVQVYSFKDQGRANAALDKLKQNGFANAYVEISDLGTRGTWYRVRIGGLQNENQAKELLENIRKNYNSGIIVKSAK